MDKWPESFMIEENDVDLAITKAPSGFPGRLGSCATDSTLLITTALQSGSCRGTCETGAGEVIFALNRYRS